MTDDAPAAPAGKKQPEAERKGPPGWVYALALLLGSGVIFYSLRSGGMIDNIDLAGLLNVKMAPKPEPQRPVVSRDFIVGTWEVEQPFSTPYGQWVGQTKLVYRPDGSVEGWAEKFANGAGQREPWQGTWTAAKVSDTEFAMDATINGMHIRSIFRVFDRNHIQNENENYVANRVE
jgi:hypothetical protein